jgi:hypothetical protein
MALDLQYFFNGSTSVQKKFKTHKELSIDLDKPILLLKEKYSRLRYYL